LAEWSSRAPDLEEDIALTNIGLDLLGQARMLYSYAGDIDGAKTEDDYAFFRNERQFSNLLLVEQPNGDFAGTIARQVLFSTYQQLLWDHMGTSADATLAAIAAKAGKETAYHLRHARTWLHRLGDGTDESQTRMQSAVDALWRFTAELFAVDDLDLSMVAAGIGVDVRDLVEPWRANIANDLQEATLSIPDDPHQNSGGRDGRHTNHLGLMLAEMQVLQRTYPGATW
jgi:ring-1,2-phenylacetyl-CoA epoxidase subunit PaaC